MLHVRNANNQDTKTGTNLFQASVPFRYPLKTWENQRFSDVFRGYRNARLAWNGLMRPSLYENFPNTQLFLVQVRENTDQKKLRIWTLFKPCISIVFVAHVEQKLQN